MRASPHKTPASNTLSACRPRFTARFNGASPPTPRSRSRPGAMAPSRRAMDRSRHAGGGRCLRSFGRVPSWCMWRAASPGRMAGLTGSCGLVRAAARKPMPLPSPGQHPRCRTPRSSNSSRDHPPDGCRSPSQCVAPRHLAAAPRCKASRCCASVEMDRRFNGIFTEVVEKGRACTVGSRSTGALLPAAPNNQSCCSPSESTIVAGAPGALS